MQELAILTIEGGEHDVSARDPPPRYHPETRISIVKQAHLSFSNDKRRKRMLWLVGPAGARRTAVMQTLAEDSANAVLGTSLFFTVNERDDASKVVITLAYQIALNLQSYRQHIYEQIVADPKLPQKSMRTQFTTPFVEPFTKKNYTKIRIPNLILIDGLDECDGHHEQCSILDLNLQFFREVSISSGVSGTPSYQIPFPAQYHRHLYQYKRYSRY